jgi:UDP-glucose 4-epimerase
MKDNFRPNALVTGATGMIGPDLIKKLVDRGCAVRALYRNQCEPDILPDTVESIHGDITDAKTLKDAVKNIDVIFHLAAKLHINEPSNDLYEEYKRINIEGTRQLVKAAGSAGVARMVFFSTINVYGCSDPATILDENSELKPVSWYARTKLEAEKIVLSGIPSVVLRLAAVYGPRMKGNYPRLLNALKSRRFIMVGNGKNRRSLVHVQDVCQAALLAAYHPAAVKRVYNVTDGEIHTLQEIVEVMCKALGRSCPNINLPANFVRRGIGWFEDVLGLFNRKLPIGRSTIDKLIEDVAVSGDRIEEELGYRPKFDLETGWNQCVRWLADESNVRRGLS